MASYLETAAKEKLKLYEQQLYQNAGSDAILSRNLKNLKQRDFKQQIQPQPAQIVFQKGKTGSIAAAQRWGRGLSGKVSGGGKGGGKSIKDISKPQKPIINKYYSSNATKIINTGSVNVMEPTAVWTTEGYMATGNDPKSTENQKYGIKGAAIYSNLGKKASIGANWQSRSGKKGSVIASNKQAKAQKLASMLPIDEAKKLLDAENNNKLWSVDWSQDPDSKKIKQIVTVK